MGLAGHLLMPQGGGVQRFLRWGSLPLGNTLGGETRLAHVERLTKNTDPLGGEEQPWREVGGVLEEKALLQEREPAWKSVLTGSMYCSHRLLLHSNLFFEMPY